MKRVHPALPDSYETLFHEANLPRFLLHLHDSDELAQALNQPRLERAIGVVYSPESERISHYFQAHLSSQFDVMIHIDSSRAVEPLDRIQPPGPEAPETYPSAF